MFIFLLYFILPLFHQENYSLRLKPSFTRVSWPKQQQYNEWKNNTAVYIHTKNIHREKYKFFLCCLIRTKNMFLYYICNC